ncbi:Dynactin subunit 1 [Cichlidogyrus casuarinus]|uniref:Dynactin subunit 1 n=1 Tax=Cichlidogyrus casuarinus TaxID=1844966 RepID=A0ABD2QAW6_9PLAT
MSSSSRIKLGSEVEIIGKDLIGTVAYMGTTTFSQGKWIGIILTEPKGRNDGMVQGKKYFTCEENHGIFVRETQVKLKGESDSPSKIANRPSSSASNTGSPTSSIYGASNSKPPSAENSPSKIAVATKSPNPKPTTESSFSPQKVEVEEPIEVVVEKPAIIQPRLSISKEPKLNDSAIDRESNQEIKNLKEEVQDLSEKLQTLMEKRNADKLRLKEADKMKMQITVLEENKKLLQEKLTEYQRELSAKNKDLLDVQQSFERYREEMTDVHETIEIATLDKEMAEAKSEECQMEMESLKVQVEELRLENEIFKTELQMKESEMLGGEVADLTVVRDSAKVQQLEQQNERMREALVKMRDLSSHDKFDISNLQKEVNALRTELTQALQERDTSNLLCSQNEQTIIDLQEQAHAALGSDSLITELSQRNLDLEEMVEKLQEERNDLEALCDANDELLETQREEELEVREELETSKQQLREMVRSVDSLKDTIVDYENTFLKFRTLVTDLKAQNRELRSSRTAVTSDSAMSEVSGSQQADALEVEMNMTLNSGTGGQQSVAKMVATELRSLEADQGKKQSYLLSTYLPESFSQSGGENDAINVVLLIDRLIFKCDLISQKIRERHPLPNIIPGHGQPILTTDEGIGKMEMVSVDSLGAFPRSKFEFHAFFTFLCAFLDQWNYILGFLRSVLNGGTLNQFQKLVASQNEMALHESSLDHLLDLAKRNQLDESVNLEALVSSLQYFGNLYVVIIALAADKEYPFPDCSVAMADFARFILASVNSLCTCAAMCANMTGIPLERLSQWYDCMNTATQSGLDTVQAIEPHLTHEDPENGPKNGLERVLFEMLRLAALIRNRARSIRRRIPKDPHSQPLNFNAKVVATLDDVFAELVLVCKCLSIANRAVGQLAAKQLEEHTDLRPDEVLNTCLSPVVLVEIPNAAKSSVDARLRSKLEASARKVHQVALAMERGEYDFDGTKKKKLIIDMLCFKSPPTHPMEMAELKRAAYITFYKYVIKAYPGYNYVNNVNMLRTSLKWIGRELLELQFRLKSGNSVYGHQEMQNDLRDIFKSISYGLVYVQFSYDLIARLLGNLWMMINLLDESAYYGLLIDFSEQFQGMVDHEFSAYAQPSPVTYSNNNYNRNYNYNYNQNSNYNQNYNYNQNNNQNYTQNYNQGNYNAAIGYNQAQITGVNELEPKKVVFVRLSLQAQEPLCVRSSNYRRAMQDLENTKIRLEGRDEELKEVNVRLKQKQQEIADLQFRAETAEKKLNNATQVNQERIISLQNQLEQSETKSSREIRELEHTVNALQADIENLERENADLIDRTTDQDHKGPAGNMIRSLLYPNANLMQTSMTSIGKGSGAMGDEGFYLTEIRALRELNGNLMQENGKLKACKMLEQMKSMKPITLLSHASSNKKENVPSEKVEKKHSECMELQSKLNDLHTRLLGLASSPFMVNLAAGEEVENIRPRSSPSYQYMKYRETLLLTEKEALEKRVTNLVEITVPDSLLKTDYGRFASKSLLSKLQKNTKNANDKPLALIKLPKPKEFDYQAMKQLRCFDQNGRVPLHLTTSELRELTANLLI